MSILDPIDPIGPTGGQEQDRLEHTAMKRYIDVVRKNDALEKRLTQMHHTQTLSAQTILTLRTDLSDARRTLTRGPSANVVEADSDPARNRFLEQMNRQLEVRLSALEQDLVGARRDAARWRDACGSHAVTLGDSVKTRLAVLVAQIAPTRNADDNDNASQGTVDAAAMQQTLAELVAENTLLRHDNTQLSLVLSDTREQVRQLREEADAFRTPSIRSPRLPVLTEVDTNLQDPPNSDAATRRHGRTASRASQRHSICGIGGVATGTGNETTYPRPLTLTLNSAASTSHARNYSLTPSLASLRSSANPPPPPYTSHTRTDSFTPSLASPRSSIAAGSLVFERDENGVPILPPGMASSSPRLDAVNSSMRRHSSTRGTASIDRPGMMSRGVSGVSSIAEGSAREEELSEGTFTHSQTHERDPSQSSTSSDAYANTSMSSTTSKRIKRLSLTPSFRPPVSPLTTDGYFPSQSLSPGALTVSPNTISAPTLESIPQRRPLKLLSCSIGVQTDQVDSQSTPTIPLTGPAINNRATLGGLGFEETSTTTAPSSNQSTPQFLSPYSSFPPTPAIDSPSMPQDGRTASLLLLIEHMSKILLRVRQADVPTLTRRLKKQHLAGDVGHLSSSTMKALTTQVAEMRTHFRGVLDEEKRQQQHLQSIATAANESLVTRKDFLLLIKLFKELFTELIELRTSVNQIILDPLAVTRLKQSVQAKIDMTDPAEQSTLGKGKQTKQGTATGLGWIAAPITKLWAASGPGPETTSPSATLSNPRSAPKLEASTSASTTHVNVEFASTGIIRRATHALPVISTTANDPADPYNSLTSISPPDTLSQVTLSRKGVGGGTIKAKPRPAISLGDGTIRGTAPTARAGLMGIFAGAPTPAVRPTLRPKASLEFHATQRRLAGRHRRQVSNAVNAVIDQPLPEDAGEDEVPPLLERTLRPRGLSDSSIRSTFQSHSLAGPADVQNRVYAPVASSYWPDRKSMVKTFGKRIQAFAGTTEPADGPPTAPSSSSVSVHSNTSTTSVPHAVRIRNTPSSDNISPMLGDPSYQGLGTSYMDILTSTSLIIDNPHLAHSHNYPTTDFGQTPL
ncbi:hypothetical protein QFC22_003772 [Naganishia vaughanmartiniae]|uniref:Uncharacterized protein n=1 Tax=Naganishia vaughanmartiniae TaxID=1424756 RepID=A0ACC2X3T0_9TREE|nr:hypothetical protein QFC22_003772 [Naganishia vaughanmartiniae]